MMKSDTGKKGPQIQSLLAMPQPARYVLLCVWQNQEGYWSGEMMPILALALIEGTAPNDWEQTLEPVVYERSYREFWLRSDVVELSGDAEAYDVMDLDSIFSWEEIGNQVARAEQHRIHEERRRAGPGQGLS